MASGPKTLVRTVLASRANANGKLAKIRKTSCFIRFFSSLTQEYPPRSGFGAYREPMAKVVRNSERIRCSQCGAAAELHTLAERYVCSSCGSDESLPAALFERLHEYKKQARGRIEAREGLEASMRPSGFSYWRTAVWTAFGVCLLLLFNLVLAIVPDHILAMREHLIGWVLEGVLAALVVTVGIGLFVWERRRAVRGQSRNVAIASTHVACQTCGGDNELKAGDPTACCAFCSGLLVPTSTVAIDLLHSVEAQRRRATLDALAPSRQTWAKKHARQSVIDAVLMWFLGILWVGGAVRIVVGYASVPPASFFEFAKSIVYCALVVLSLVAIAWFRKERKTMERSLSRVAASFGVTMRANPDGYIRWLETYWPDPVDLSVLIQGKHSNAELCYGFEFGFFGPDGETWPVSVHLRKAMIPRLDLRLAGWIAPGVDRRHAESLLPWFHEHGYSVSLSECGLTLSLRDEVSIMLNHTTARVTHIEKVLQRAAGIAHSLQMRSPPELESIVPSSH